LSQSRSTVPATDLTC